MRVGPVVDSSWIEFLPLWSRKTRPKPRIPPNRAIFHPAWHLLTKSLGMEESRLDVQQIINEMVRSFAAGTGVEPQVAIRATRGWPKPARIYEVTVATAQQVVRTKDVDVHRALDQAFQALVLQIQSDAQAVQEQVADARVIPFHDGRAKRTA